jgi:hypothetical protein
MEAFEQSDPAQPDAPGAKKLPLGLECLCNLDAALWAWQYGTKSGH